MDLSLGAVVIFASLDGEEQPLVLSTSAVPTAV